MASRKDFEMTQADLDALMSAMKPVPYMIIGGMAPRSQQENANAAWASLGAKMGFDPMTARPNGRGDRFFSAVPVEVVAPPVTERKIVTSNICPPIPIRDYDWTAHYEGEEEAGNYGYGPTEAAAIKDFKDNCAEVHDERLAKWERSA
jgi:hypothetical protein